MKLYRTTGGVNKDERNPKIVSAQPIMWIKAIDIVMEKIRLLEFPIDTIVGISGAGQVLCRRDLTLHSKMA